MTRSLLASIFLAVALTACSDVPSATPSRDLSAANAVAAAAQSTSTSINVTSTLFDTDASGTPLYTRSDDYNGSGFATYVTTGTTKGYTSQIGPNGNWKLFLGNQTARNVYLVLGSQGVKSASGTLIPDGYYSANVEVYSQCYDAGGTQVPLTNMTAGQANGNCSFGVDFNWSGTVYKLVMGPQYPGTGRAMVTCTAASAGCTAWTIAPNAGAANAGVAQLGYYSRNGVLTMLAYYHNSFRVTAAE